MTSCLFCLVSNEASGNSSFRLTAKLLTSSLLRNFPQGMLRVLRPKAAIEAGGLFKVARAGLFEGAVSADCGHKCGCGHPDHGRASVPPWKCLAEMEKPEDYTWVLFLGNGSLVLRQLDHLLTVESDILWAPMEGVPVQAQRSGAFLTDQDRIKGAGVPRPFSRPWRDAASAGVWAVRGEHFASIMTEWGKIADASPRQSGITEAARAESAWNRLLMDTPLRVARFEKEEVQFPCLPGADFMSWKDAAILNVSDWPPEAQSKFLQAWFYGTYFADPTGLFLEMVEP